MFDAPEYAKAFEPPTFRDLDGRLHVGRLMGAHSWMKLQPALRAANKDGTPNHRAIEKASFEIVVALFPAPWWAPWRRGRVARLVWKLPPVMRLKAFWDFMGSQARWLGLPVLDKLPGKYLAATQPSDSPASPSSASETPGA